MDGHKYGNKALDEKLFEGKKGLTGKASKKTRPRHELGEKKFLGKAFGRTRMWEKVLEKRFGRKRVKDKGLGDNHFGRTRFRAKGLGRKVLWEAFRTK